LYYILILELGKNNITINNNNLYQMAVSRKPSCPSGHILRESYYSKSGKLVKARCIRKTGLLPGKASEKSVLRRSKALASAKKALRMSRKAGISIPSRCKTGMTLRVGYTRKSYNRKIGTHVRHALIAPGCVKTRGKTGPKSRVISIDPDDHFLSEFGYHDVENKTKEERYQSLHKLIAHFEPIKGKLATWNYVIRALNARYILNRNTNPKIARIMKADQRIISKEYKQVKKDM
jgi:hypothetical protein